MMRRKPFMVVIPIVVCTLALAIGTTAEAAVARANFCAGPGRVIPIVNQDNSDGTFQFDVDFSDETAPVCLVANIIPWLRAVFPGDESFLRGQAFYRNYTTDTQCTHQSGQVNGATIAGALCSLGAGFQLQGGNGEYDVKCNGCVDGVTQCAADAPWQCLQNTTTGTVGGYIEPKWKLVDFNAGLFQATLSAALNFNLSRTETDGTQNPGPGNPPTCVPCDQCTFDTTQWTGGVRVTVTGAAGVKVGKWGVQVGLDVIGSLQLTGIGGTASGTCPPPTPGNSLCGQLCFRPICQGNLPLGIKWKTAGTTRCWSMGC